VFAYREILAELRRAHSPGDRQALNMAVFRLRRRIEREPARPDILLTEAGVGYRLAPESNEQSNPDVPQAERRGYRDLRL
jgi:two-component system KDP operon response regulator KdpE